MRGKLNFAYSAYSTATFASYFTIQAECHGLIVNKDNARQQRLSL